MQLPQADFAQREKETLVAAMLVAMSVGKAAGKAAPVARAAASVEADAANFELAHGLADGAGVRPPKVGMRVTHKTHGSGVLTAIGDTRPRCVYNTPCLGEALARPYRVEYECAPNTTPTTAAEEEAAADPPVKSKSKWKRALESKRSSLIVGYASAAEVDGVPANILALL